MWAVRGTFVWVKSNVHRSHVLGDLCTVRHSYVQIPASTCMLDVLYPGLCSNLERDVCFVGLIKFASLVHGREQKKLAPSFPLSKVVSANDWEMVDFPVPLWERHRSGADLAEGYRPPHGML